MGIPCYFEGGYAYMRIEAPSTDYLVPSFILFFLSVPFDKTVLGYWAEASQFALVISVCKEFYFFQEQVTELLQVKSFKRKYPDCPRRFSIHFFFRCWASL